MSIEVRSTAAAAAQSGVGDTLSATSQPGDLAVLIVSCQFTAVSGAYPTLPGWDYRVVDAVNSRSGYTATLTVTDPAQTQGVSWWAPEESWTARQNGVMIVLSGAELAATTPWQQAPPNVEGTTILASQQHGPANVRMNAWEAGTILAAGADRADASWSALRVAMTDAAPGGDLSGPAAWASVALVPVTPPVITHDAEVDGAGADVYVWDGGREVPARMRPMPRGARTVAELLAKPRFIVAHRGGSGSWPEHTKRAYTQAVAHGVDALEISCGRSSDGVWFGAHDQSLERVGGPSTPVSELTWAEIESAMAGTEYLPARLDWLIDTYGDSHVILFDPKYELSRSDEYLELLEPYRDRVIVKFSGDGNWKFDVIKGAGFTTWAYGYASWKTGQPSAWANLTTDPNKDILSMEYGAPSDVWADLKATGKPLTSHIPETKAAVEAGWAAGADGSIVAGVAAYLPTSV